MPKTFGRNSIAYADRDGRFLGVDQPDRAYRAKANNFVLTRPTAQGAASGNIAPTAGIDGEIAVGIESSTRNPHYTTNGTSWTRWGTPTDAYQAFVNNIGSQFNSHTLEGSFASGLELHYWQDIAGTPTDTRCKLGGSTSTSSEALDRENNNLLVNGGDVTPGASGSTSGGDSSNGWMHEADEVPLPSGEWRVSMKIKYASISGNSTVWACGWSSVANRVGINFINASFGTLRVQVGSDSNVATLNNGGSGYADDDTYIVDLEYDGDDGFTITTYTDAGVEIESDSGTGTWSPGTTSNGEFTLFGRADSVTANRYDGLLSDVQIYDNGVLIRDWPLTDDYALVDASMPAGGNIQDNNLFTRSNGTTVFTPYANPGTSVASHSYRSTDGIHFARVYTNAVVNTGQNNHGHVCFYSENYGLWVLSKGDQDNKIDIVSDDDALNWQTLRQSKETRQQFIELRDHPNGVGLVAGHDDRATFSYFEIEESGGDYSIVNQVIADSGIHRYDAANGGTLQEAYAWVNKPIDGVFWGSFNDFSTTERSSLMVSLDAYQYTTIHRFGANEGGVKNLTKIGDYYIAGITDRTATEKYNYIQVRWTLDNVSSALASRVSPGCTNLLGEDESTGATTTGSTASGSATTSLAAGTGGQVGDSTIEVSASDTGSIRMLGDAVTTTPTEYITYTCYLKGVMTEATTAGLFDTVNTNQIGRGGISLDDNWQLAYGPVLELASGGTTHRLDINHGVQGDSEDVTLSVDRAALYAGSGVVQPLPWMIGGTAMSAEALTETTTRGASWSETYTLFPASDSLQMRSEVPVMSQAGASSTARLVWDAANSRWLLEVTGETDVVSSATVFDRNEQIEVEWTVSSGGTVCAVTHGGTTYTLNGAAKSDLYSADIDWATESLWAFHEAPSDGGGRGARGTARGRGDRRGTRRIIRRQ